MDTPQPQCEAVKVSVYNLSSQEITEDEISLLRLGTNFVPATLVPKTDTKVDILRFSRSILNMAHFHNSDYVNESIVKPASCYIPKTTKSSVLKGIVEDLEVFANEFPSNIETLKVIDNLTVDQRVGLTTFKRRKSILYFKADKGSGVVLLNEMFYKYKVLAILNTEKYEKLPRNVDYFVNLKLKSLIKKYQALLTSQERRAIVNFDYRTTNIYGLPKIHKSEIINEAIKDVKSTYLHLRDPVDLSFRLIFGGPENPCSVLADLLNTLLNPFRSKVKSSLKDTFDFIRRIPTFAPEDLPFIEIVLVDVKSMYESLTQKLGLPALRLFLTQYKYLIPSRLSVDFIIESMTFVLNNNTGYFNGEIYRQRIGTATGIKPAPPYADLAMGYLEVQLFYKLRAKLGENVAKYFWDTYLRFLDDGIIFWDKRLGEFNEVFKCMNEIDNSIKFTMERSDSSLKYLDVLVYKTDVGFKTVVQTKNTDSETFLHFKSSHPRHCKENIPQNMARRVKALTDDSEMVNIQMAELSSRLLKAGYPEGLVYSAVQNAKSLSTADLRKPKEGFGSNKILPFVHTYDPAHPTLLKEIRALISRLFTSLECKQIFGDTKIIDSRREPSSILRLLQHSKFDEFGSNRIEKGVAKCHIRNCGTCSQIMETDSIYFENAGFSFRVNAKMDCTVRNVIYALFCEGCNKSYLGETVCLRNRASSHRSSSKSDLRAVMDVSKHLLCCNKGFRICPIYKVKKQCKILRLVIEDDLIKLLKPDLNADRRNLLHLQMVE